MGQNVGGLYFNYMDPLKPDQSSVYFWIFLWNKIFNMMCPPCYIFSSALYEYVIKEVMFWIMDRIGYETMKVTLKSPIPKSSTSY